MMQSLKMALKSIAGNKFRAFLTMLEMCIRDSHGATVPPHSGGNGR